MGVRIRTATLAVACTLGVSAISAAGAQAGLLSILPGSCSNQPESQPFAGWGDSNYYTPVPGGSFEAGAPAWMLTGGAGVVTGNESFDVAGATDSRSLALPAGSSATSPAMCTSIYHPSARFFVRNAGSSASHLKVEVLYPGLLGGVNTSTVASLTGASSWAPSPQLGLLVSNLLATLSLDQTAIAFRFVPADSTGSWQIDDVYLDPYARG